MIKTAIILAPDDKGLQPIFGIPVVRRLSLLLDQIGFESIHIVGHVNSLIPIFSDLTTSPSFHQVEGPALLDQVVEKLALSKEETVLVLKANYVIDRYSLTQLMRAADNSNRYFMEAKGNNPLEGFYLVHSDDLVPLLRALWLPDRSTLQILNAAHRVCGVAGLPSVLDTGQKQVKIAEAALLSALACQTEADDSFLARHFDRRISRSISKRLVRTRVTPNQITLGGMTIGLLGALLLSRPGYWPQLIGSLLFLLCVVVDGVDGEIARLKLQESPFGHYLDVVTDNIVHIAIFVGIAFGLYHDTGNQNFLSALWFLIGGFGLCAISVYQCILKPGHEKIKNSSKIVRLMALLTNRDFAYLLVALALVHHLSWFLWGAAVGTYLFAAMLWTMNFQENRALSH